MCGASLDPGEWTTLDPSVGQVSPFFKANNKQAELEFDGLDEEGDFPTMIASPGDGERLLRPKKKTKETTPTPTIDHSATRPSPAFRMAPPEEADVIVADVDLLSEEEMLPSKPKSSGYKDPLLGQRIGNYEVVEKIGRGGFGSVYKAQQIFLDESFAIKFLHSEQDVESENTKRFIREARALAQLRHPYIVQILDFGLLEELGFYLVMELLQGKSLADTLKEETLSHERILTLVKQLCQVLDFVHNKSVLHRDLKPDNIYLTRSLQGQEEIKLFDFGIAALRQETGDITQTGEYVGTVRYAAPEQLDKDLPMDGRADLYALGVIVYQMLCGTEPFHDFDGISLLYAKLNESVRLLSDLAPERRWAPELELFLQTSLAIHPDKRPANALAFYDAFEKAMKAQQTFEGEPPNLQDVTTDLESITARSSLSALPIHFQDGEDEGDATFIANDDFLKELEEARASLEKSQKIQQIEEDGFKTYDNLSAFETTPEIPTLKERLSKRPKLSMIKDAQGQLREVFSWGIFESPPQQAGFWAQWKKGVLEAQGDVCHVLAVDTLLLGDIDELVGFCCNDRFDITHCTNPAEGIYQLYQAPPALMLIRVAGNSLRWIPLFGEMQRSVRLRKVPMLLFIEDEDMQAEFDNAIRPFSHILFRKIF
tara:strand:- start:6269 stop:8233 length:1965 start_codon:yes stop_codon:yes gene_type:complete